MMKKSLLDIKVTIKNLKNLIKKVKNILVGKVEVIVIIVKKPEKLWKNI